jgi:hypothetical protein
VSQSRFHSRSRSNDHPREHDPLAWRALSEAGLVEIRLDEFAERIKDVKHTVIERLRELLDRTNGLKERESAAYSLGTLKGLELKLLANPPKPPNPSEK